ncbi:hypothetical protein [Gottfriedia solisilvae]|uniref:Uncharacterized protein n=1 Tax=Gottfriedia solisilvae TaxID=1516104 RepID=A0A8J3F2F0_9BACI|nr:hypothetical protein [Gottfriedia solisilvae]GGI17899.1 hypothetical protein GCM10007380_40240 [Gottfriedia solisilvae]
MKSYADIQYFLDEKNNISSVLVTKYRMRGQTQVLEERVSIERNTIYALNLRETNYNSRDKSVVIQEFILDDLGNPLDVLVFFRESSTYGKVEVIELSVAN